MPIKLKKQGVFIFLAAVIAILILALIVPRMMSYSAEQQAKEHWNSICDKINGNMVISATDLRLGQFNVENYLRPENFVRCLNKNTSPPTPYYANIEIKFSDHTSVFLQNWETDFFSIYFDERYYEIQNKELFTHVQAKDQILPPALTPASDSAYDHPDAVLVSTIPLYTAKLTRDGSEQAIKMDILSFGENTYAYMLNVANANGKVIWTTELFQAHAGWMTILFTRVDGKDYLMRYMPSIYHGHCEYDFTVFSLDSDGNEIVLDADSVSFGTNPPGGSGAFRKSHIEPMRTFYEHVNRYLAVSDLLLSTDETFLKNLPKEQYGKETGEKYAYGTKDAPITDLQDYFYGSADLTFDEQMKAFIKSYTEEYGEPED